eukprot:3167087-Prymnesium_polylepis.3
MGIGQGPGKAQAGGKGVRRTVACLQQRVTQRPTVGARHAPLEEAVTVVQHRSRYAQAVKCDGKPPLAVKPLALTVERLSDEVARPADEPGSERLDHERVLLQQPSIAAPRVRQVPAAASIGVVVILPPPPPPSAAAAAAKPAIAARRLQEQRRLKSHTCCS